MKDKLGDWRVASVTTLAKDFPSATPGGKVAKAGTPVSQTTHVKTKSKGYVGFVIPSATAMAINVAIKSSVQANVLRKKIKYRKVSTPDGEGNAVADGSIGSLYNYFEYSMTSVTFSFQAIESFCNQVVGSKLKGKFKIKRRSGVEEFTSEEIERYVSTEEKLTNVLPVLFDIQSPKGAKVWESFQYLKGYRDSIVHIKTKDQYSTSGVDDALYYQILDSNLSFFPRIAVDTISFFYKSGTEPRWLLEAKRKVVI